MDFESNSTVNKRAHYQYHTVFLSASHCILDYTGSNGGAEEQGAGEVGGTCGLGES